MRSYLKLLYPGMHLKRWILVLLCGITIISLGIGYLEEQTYRIHPLPDWIGLLTLQSVDRPVRGIALITTGTLLSILATLGLGRSLLIPFVDPQWETLATLIQRHHYRRRGPRIVAIGGGTGLSTLLRGLKEYTSNLTAIVTVADDGGSSGRLRRDLGILPPGDFRQCLAALADAEPLMTQLFQYRFGEGSGLAGHSFGNLFIAALTAVTGSFEGSLRASSHVLAIRGEILPSTLENLQLGADFVDGSTTLGESCIPKAQKRIRRIFLKPRNPPAYPPAIRAIIEADLIVVGPGSLFSSVLPNLLVEDLTRAIRNARAIKVYVCNVAAERGETDGFDVDDYLEAIERHVGPDLFDCVLVNSNHAVDAPTLVVDRLVKPPSPPRSGRCHLVAADVIDTSVPGRHDPAKLARALLQIYHRRGTWSLARPALDLADR